MKATHDEKELAAIAEKAAWWFVANRSGPGSAEEREAFSAWLRESPMHVREYLAVATLARDFASIVQESSIDAAPLALPEQAVPPDNNVVSLDGTRMGSGRLVPPVVVRPSPWRVPRFAMAALAAVIVVTVWFVATGGGTSWRGQTYQTGRGQQQTVQLADGSVLRLNSNSKATVHFSSAERRVDLEAGQALFDVAHEAGRRFRVVAGGLSVVAIGTRFDVYRRPSATVVTVVEGKVAVAHERRRLPIVGLSPTRNDGGVAVTAGEQLRVPQDDALPEFLAGGGDISASVAVNVDEAVAWVRQQIVFEQKALAEVAEEFNRYGVIPIRIEDPELGRMRVTGILSTYDTEAFIGFLRRLDGVSVVATPVAVHVMRDPPAGSAPGATPGSGPGAG